MRDKIEFIVLILVILGLLTLNRNIWRTTVSNQATEGNYTVVLDAGHGGEDPGKVGINGAKEKDINLAIAKKVKKYLEEQKITVYMTREEDCMLAETGSTNKKVEDMKARVEKINDSQANLAVSIHQNSYQEEGVKGAQVFYYSHSQEGQKDAITMQNALLELDASNTRKAKENDTYYILKRTEIPTIIVECGFLSNQEEADLLVTEAYQEDVAKSIVKGIITCFED